MAIANAIIADFEETRKLSFGSITADYVAVGSAFNNALSGLKVYNTTNSALDIAFDGITNKEFVPSNGFFVWDFGANKTDSAGMMKFPPKRVYVKIDEDEDLPTAGKVVVVALFANSK